MSEPEDADAHVYIWRNERGWMINIDLSFALREALVTGTEAIADTAEGRQAPFGGPSRRAGRDVGGCPPAGVRADDTTHLVAPAGPRFQTRKRPTEERSISTGYDHWGLPAASKRTELSAFV